MSRGFWVAMHRYAGLYIAVYLGVIGLAGSLIAFYDELDHALAPELHRVASLGARLDPTALIARAEELAPTARATDVGLEQIANESVMIRMAPRVDPATGKLFAVDFTEMYLDPYTGGELGRRKFGDLSQGVINVMPFIYRFHYSFALGDFGTWLVGVTALIWTFDSFVGFYLTLPAPKPETHANSRRSWIGRWKVAWIVKWRASAIRVNYDIHRAAGLWLWLLLVIFAWSSVSFNLRDHVYAPVMRAIASFDDPWTKIPLLDAPLEEPPMGWSAAHQRGRRLMKAQAIDHGFDTTDESRLALDREHGVYIYSAHSTLDLARSVVQTSVIFSANDGALISLDLPSGQSAGKTVTNWLAALHTGKAFGLPYRMLVSLLGLAVTTLSVTGVYIWWKKRKARKSRAERLAVR